MSGLRPQECIPVPYAGRRVKEVFIDLSVPSEHLWSVNAKDCDDTRFYYGGIYVDKSTKRRYDHRSQYSAYDCLFARSLNNVADR